ncbi:MAG: 5-methyltetrahydrofolate--homocysteine S-methyltransferase, cobalamin-dependent [Deltaproteobacteria bacterium]|nr:5-methyltetrahydrofolate--homocysteine S-methyltransferase, cobalamin-dependent [Deltaproteobacteria bacterium]
MDHKPIPPGDRDLLLFDGACGTNLQRVEIPASAWQGHEGCNEFLNVSAAGLIRDWHESFLSAGSMVLETNTFGANGIVLAEYGLEGRVAEINRAAVENAREAIRRTGADAYIAGSLGPTTKLPSLGHIGREALSAAYAEQVRALVDAGADLLIFETCQDLLQVKIALVSCFETLESMRRDVPVMVSLTVESTGTMLVGTDVAAALAALEPYPLFSLGLNCATGPEGMISHVRHLCRNYRGRVSCIPNAGIPAVSGGKTVYPLSPEAFAAQVSAFVREEGVSIVGGCCGTTPEHIRKLREALEGARPAARDAAAKPSLGSLYQAVEIRQEIPPFLIGERCNANGSKRFRELLLADDFDGALRIALDQQRDGAHALDLCTAYAGRDELADIETMARLFARSVHAPMVVDSTQAACIEAALSIHPGRCLVNSVNLEDGGKNLERVCRAARRHGAAVIALTIDEKGMALTAGEKVAVAKRIHDLAVGRYGLRPQDLVFDVLTFTIGSGDESLTGSAAETLAAVRRVKEELPGVFTSLGVSNISFGLAPASRKALNSVFLHEAVAAGLDMAIIDAGKILPMSTIPVADREACLDLIHNRPRPDGEPPLSAFIRHFAVAPSAAEKSASEKDRPALPPEEELAEKVLSGDPEGLEDLLAILLSRRPAASIINQLLVPAMRRVGDLFGRGEMLLPFVLKSAEVMKRAVDRLTPYLEKSEAEGGRKVLLATVAGDVHDIGKNLVDIILSNNGYRVFNLGIKVPAETIIEKAASLGVDVIGLSGLLVKSALVMKENLPQFAAAGLTTPVLLGGAALTEKFVARECAPAYPGPVVYCADAFAGLSALREFEAGTLKSTVFESEGPAAMIPGPKGASVARDVPAPEPPFLGRRHVTGIDPALLFPYVNEQALFRGRWGFRRGKMTAEAYSELIRDKVRPMYEELKARAVSERILRPQVAYGWFRCFSEGDTLAVEHEGRLFRFPFPRQGAAPHLCIADYFRRQEDGGDVAGFFVATVGDGIAPATRELFEADRYHDYLMLHAFGVEVTDALAEYWHEVMRSELGIAGDRPSSLSGYVAQEYRGSRYGFGYPSCPDLAAHLPVFELLDPGKIGVTLTESMEMVPEQTTSAIVVHHPQAKYFAV